MRLKKAKRIYTTKILNLIERTKIFNYGYPYEFMNKMTENEINLYLNEVRKQLKEEEIPTKNINMYNNMFRIFIKDREDIYQMFKRNYLY